MGYFVGAYAITPAALADEEALLAGLAAMPAVRRLELPFTGALHRSDEAWLFARLRPGWDYVVTLIPGTMGRLAGDRHSAGPHGPARPVPGRSSQGTGAWRWNAMRGEAWVGLPAGERVGGTKPAISMIDGPP